MTNPLEEIRGTTRLNPVGRCMYCGRTDSLAPSPKTAHRVLEFFTAQISNDH